MLSKRFIDIEFTFIPALSSLFCIGYPENREIVLGLIPSALDPIIILGSGFFSMISILMFGLDDMNRAAASPTGPAPTISNFFFYISDLFKRYNQFVNVLIKLLYYYIKLIFIQISENIRLYISLMIVSL